MVVPGERVQLAARSLPHRDARILRRIEQVRKGGRGPRPPGNQDLARTAGPNCLQGGPPAGHCVTTRGTRFRPLARGSHPPVSTASAMHPTPSPDSPRPSGRVALTDTWSTPIPRVAATFLRISSRAGAIAGRSAMTVTSAE
jgi:hypothetical protein